MQTGFLVHEACTLTVHPEKATRIDILEQCTRVDMNNKVSPSINIAHIEEALLLDTTSTKVLFCAKRTYKLRVCYGIHVYTLPATERLLDTGAERNLSQTKFIHQDYMSRNKHKDLSKLLTATMEPVRLHETILLHLRIGDLTARVWSGIVPILAVDVLLGTSFIDLFVRSNFPSERKVVPWYSQLVGILVNSKREARNDHAPILKAPVWQDGAFKQSTEITTHSVHIAKQQVIPPNIAKATLVTTETSCLLTVVPRHLPCE